MHEMAVVQGLMAILIAQAKAHEIGRIARVRLKIGRLRGLDARQICAAFELFSEGTIAEGAELDVEEIAAEAHCQTCGTIWRLAGYRLECPSCGTAAADVIKGRELFIESFDGESNASS
jgi:hydrogenase nickel incorporation protein HypA/HybF